MPATPQECPLWAVRSTDRGNADVIEARCGSSTHRVSLRCPAENVRFADKNYIELRRKIDAYIERNGIVAPPPTDDPAETVPPRIPSPPITSLDLEIAGISTIIWCTGFDGDYSWVKVPRALGADQQPAHVDGTGVVEGIYFAGLDFASTRKLGTILASVDESRTIVKHILQRLSPV